MSAFTWSVVPTQKEATAYLRIDGKVVEHETFSDTDNAPAVKQANQWLQEKLKSLGAL